ITVQQEVDAGLDNATAQCNTIGSTVDINTLLSGADPGGVFAETSASGAFNAATGILNTDGLAAGVYTFTYTMTGIAPCLDDVANFTVTVEQEVDAGLDNATAQCNTIGSTIDINTLLSGADPGGTWAETSASGAFNAATGVLNTDGLAAGAYTFTYTMTGIAPCPNDVSDFTVTVEQEAFAGADNATTSCNIGASTVDMNTLLSGADPGGTWAETTASGTFDPATGIFTTGGLAAGTYTFTYTVTPVAPCLPDVADFTVIVSAAGNAGLDNSTSICNLVGSTVDMNTLLSGADPGGAWAETSASGAFNTSTGVLNTDGLGAGSYTFTYTVTPTAPCPSDVADFTVTVEQEAIAGPDNAATMCNTGGSTMDLNTLLSGAAAGTWVETSASGQFTAATGMFDASGLAPAVYTFTYTVTGVAPCIDDVADISVTVTNLPNAGTDSTEQICNVSGSTVDLTLLLSGADPGGTWAETTGSGAFDTSTGIFNTDGVPAGTYTFIYDLPAVGPCPGDQAVFNVTVEQEVNAGTDDFTPEICNQAGTTVDLTTSLSGADAGGAWTETSASGAFAPGTGILNTDGLSAGVYTFTYEVFGVAPCPNDLADFTVTVQQEVYAGLDDLTASCNDVGTIIDLSTSMLDPLADAGGTWAETTGSGTFDTSTGTFDISSLSGGTYTFTYTVFGISPCPNDVASFDVTVNEVPILDPLSDEELCDQDNLVSQLFTSSVAGATYTWTNLTGTDIGFGLSGSGTSIGGFTGNTGSTLDETVTIEVIPSTAFCTGVPLTFNITVHPIPQVMFDPQNVVGCEPLYSSFTNLFPGLPGAICNWTFGDGTSSTTCDFVSHEYGTEGFYDVGLTVTTMYGCTNSVLYSNLIEVYPQAVANFEYSPYDITVSDTRVDFTNSSSNAMGYTWDFGDGSGNSSDTDPSHTYPEIGNVSYTVTLTAHSAGGCDATISKIITIDDVIIFYVPNVFTPDGDSYNEVFKPIMTAGYDVYDYHLTIFNRWGEVVFESFDAAFGWDGTYGNEGLVQDGVYVWAIEFGETMSDKKHRHKGHVTILK
ncbi:gliding motility-associated C-terminal domain-containing protein, partial [Crocinitomix catalasitica]|nr:gliding motility-associated C-terminal domain-containing protein [Crocinitomix catalasitica]